MAQPREFGKDTGLQFRIVFVLFLLGAVYAVLVAALIAAGVNAALVAVIAVVLLLVQLFASDKIGLAAMGAHEATPDQAPELHAMIERLCVQANLPKPKVALVETQVPNAFAMGRSPKNATVCVTTGILQLLSPAELEGVLAHELTHVQNRDVVVMTLASFFATIAAYIVQFGFFFGGDDDSEEGGIGVLGLILVSLVVYAVSFVLLPRVRGRPRLGHHHRPPQRAGLGPVEDCERERAHPRPGPALDAAAEGLLHLLALGA